MLHAIRMAFSRKPYMVCLLLLSILLQTFSKAVIYVDFYANQDYIARNLCENRDKPMLHCCGRCQLRKRLAQQDQQDKNDPGKRANEVSVLLYYPTGSRIEILPPPTALLQHCPSSSDTRVIDQPSFCFHPPD